MPVEGCTCHNQGTQAPHQLEALSPLLGYSEAAQEPAGGACPCTVGM